MGDEGKKAPRLTSIRGKNPAERLNSLIKPENASSGGGAAGAGNRPRFTPFTARPQPRPTTTTPAPQRSQQSRVKKEHTRPTKRLIKQGPISMGGPANLVSPLMVAPPPTSERRADREEEEGEDEGMKVVSFPEEQVQQSSAADMLKLGVDQLLLVQLPSHLPIDISPEPQEEKPSGTFEQTDKYEMSANTLTQLPAGYAGKLRVRKSGKVELVLGDVVLEVVPGAPCQFTEHAVTVDKQHKTAAHLGPVVGHLVCHPNIDSLLE